jgi:hypothetical protein
VTPSLSDPFAFALAADLVRLTVDIIVAGGDPGIRAAKNATETIPIVTMGGGADPIEAGFVKSLARPGGSPEFPDALAGVAARRSAHPFRIAGAAGSIRRAAPPQSRRLIPRIAQFQMTATSVDWTFACLSASRSISPVSFPFPVSLLFQAQSKTEMETPYI